MVDDEKSYVDLLATMLTENLGYTVHTFTRPREALAALPSLDVGIVITDYCMPQLTGIDFVRLAAPLLNRVPFIMISGHPVSIPEDLFGPEKPLRALLAKPFGWRKLAELIAVHAPDFAAARVSANPFPV